MMEDNSKVEDDCKEEDNCKVEDYCKSKNKTRCRITTKLRTISLEPFRTVRWTIRWRTSARCRMTAGDG